MTATGPRIIDELTTDDDKIVHDRLQGSKSPQTHLDAIESMEKLVASEASASPACEDDPKYFSQWNPTRSMDPVGRGTYDSAWLPTSPLWPMLLERDRAGTAEIHDCSRRSNARIQNHANRSVAAHPDLGGTRPGRPCTTRDHHEPRSRRQPTQTVKWDGARRPLRSSAARSFHSPRPTAQK